jgi:hypothetical protein
MATPPGGILAIAKALGLIQISLTEFNRISLVALFPMTATAQFKSLSPGGTFPIM